MAVPLRAAAADPDLAHVVTGPGAGGPGRTVNRNVTINRNVVVNRGGPVVGRRYHGGVWYGTGRRYWRGQWYAYGVGPCWLASPIGFVWVCG